MTPDTAPPTATQARLTEYVLLRFNEATSEWSEHGDHVHAKPATRMPGSHQPAHQLREQTAAREAAELVVYADGFEVAYPELARRTRNVARELRWALTELEAERSARQAMQQARDHAVDLLRRRIDERQRDQADREAELLVRGAV